VFRENSAFDIRGAAGGEVDDEVKCFALIKRRLFRCKSLGPYRYAKRAADSEE
jgi:hypothetical protein